MPDVILTAEREFLATVRSSQCEWIHRLLIYSTLAFMAYGTKPIIDQNRLSEACSRVRAKPDEVKLCRQCTAGAEILYGAGNCPCLAPVVCGQGTVGSKNLLVIMEMKVELEKNKC